MSEFSNLEKRVYTIATAHLDTVWLWDLNHTIKMCIPATLNKNFELFEKYPEYSFSFEGAYRYELMEEYHPELFEKMLEYQKKGRWHPTGSLYENGDWNIPSAEAHFRNVLYGNDYFEKTFGKPCIDLYLPDCFGFGWVLPSVAAHSGCKAFMTKKLSESDPYGIPLDRKSVV